MFLRTKPGLKNNQLPKSLFSSESSRIRRSGYLKRCRTKNQKKPSKVLSFREFIALVNPKYKFYRHLDNLISVLQRVADGEITRLMVFMPPRHGKSETISRLFTAYYLYRYPDRWVGLNSYADALASTLSRNARENYKSSGGLINHDAASAHHWETLESGGMWAAGVGGPITGKGFHLGIIDDPVKNAKEAASEIIREGHKDWYKSTFLTREEPNAAIINVQTRWNEDDLGGWLLSQEGEEDDDPEHWHIVCMEAIKEYESPKFPDACTVESDDRQPGEALCPERYDITKLNRRKKRLGSYYWNALYQQVPSPDEGGIFKRHWWRYWKPKGVTLPPIYVKMADASLMEIKAVDLPDTFEEMIQSWDCSFKDIKTSDFVAGGVLGRLGANKFLLDYYKERADINKTIEAIEAFSEKWPKAFAKLIEDKANGSAVIQLLRDNMSGLIAVEPEGGKISRAYAAAPGVESHNVFLPHPLLYPWVQGFIDSCAGFPHAAHDDDVDMFTQAMIRLQAPPPKPRQPTVSMRTF